MPKVGETFAAQPSSRAPHYENNTAPAVYLVAHTNERCKSRANYHSDSLEATREHYWHWSVVTHGFVTISIARIPTGDLNESLDCSLSERLAHVHRCQHRRLPRTCTIGCRLQEQVNIINGLADRDRGWSPFIPERLRSVTVQRRTLPFHRRFIFVFNNEWN